MNIIHVTRGFGRLTLDENPGAVESVIFNLARNLASIGNNVTIIDGGEYKKIKTFENISISIVDINKSFLSPRKIKIARFIFEEIHFVFFGYKVSKYIKEIGVDKVDILHVHLPLIGMTILLLNPSLSSKIVYTSHVSIWSLNSKSLLEKAILFLDVLLMKMVKRVIALNAFLRDKFISAGISPDKINIVNNGVNIKTFDNVDISILDQRYKLKDVNILFVGRFDKIKGIKYLLGAANILVNNWRHTDISFILVGPHVTTNVNESENIDTIHSYIRDNNLENNIIITGYISDNELKVLYRTCDIVVVPSLAEADPLVTLEAMAAGKPVIGTKVGGISNQIMDNYNGFIVEPESEIEIADKIRYLLNNREKLKVFGDNSRKRINDYFTWEKVSKDLYDIYKHIKLEDRVLDQT